MEPMRRTNVDGLVMMTRAALPTMKERGWGRIVNITSVAAHGTGMAGTTFYAATKAAVITLTRRFALDLGKYGITVNAVAPGFVPTDMARSATTGQMERNLEAIANLAMVGRVGRPEDIAARCLLPGFRRRQLHHRTDAHRGRRADRLHRTPMKKLLGALLFLLGARAQETPQWRPLFHFTPPRNFMNDPNGLVYYRGEYHLFYQHNPFGEQWGHMSWGHAVSKDMVRWQHLPVALSEENGIMIFSGSAVVDRENSSGLCQGQECLIAIYTGHFENKQTQNLAVSDDGRTFRKFAGNPVIDLNERDFRDPKVFWA